MEGLPPRPPGSQNQNKDDVNMATAPVSKAYDGPNTPSGGMNGINPTPINGRASSRGSNFGGLDDGNNQMYINVDRNQPLPLNKLNTMKGNSQPLMSKRVEFPQSSYRK